MRTFAAGPASDTIANPCRPNRKLRGSTGTGLPHPKPRISNIIVPAGSKCALGLSVILPSLIEVGSPSFLAIKACEASWKVIPIINERLMHVIRTKKAKGSSRSKSV